MIGLDAILGIGGKQQILNLDSGMFYRDCKLCGQSKQSSKFRATHRIKGL